MQHWKVLFVKPRTEKKIAEYCQLYGISYYLPLREKTRVAQRRKITVRLPVFPGYVFARVISGQRLALLQTNLLVRILAPESPRRMLRDLVMVRRALRVNPALESAKPLTAGRLVRIIDGPFQGVEGRVARLAGTLKVVLNVEMIGQAISVTAEIDQVEVL
ncbi:MAG TPA: transcription termination/antitermination NusG family protein [Kiritimatiellia bacterium]|nr:transcription termination/antitermination NusG family protein [Kiritimatiellia bacterium]HRU69491.1 transcription termination/antitermination NusG family protein [Kiritimatiellia bacterium]